MPWNWKKIRSKSQEEKRKKEEKPMVSWVSWIAPDASSLCILWFWNSERCLNPFNTANSKQVLVSSRVDKRGGRKKCVVKRIWGLIRTQIKLWHNMPIVGQPVAIFLTFQLSPLNLQILLNSIPIKLIPKFQLSNQSLSPLSLSNLSLSSKHAGHLP